ncbi:MAG TPA: hypothetical protein VKY85_04585 [Candidatus Angelobacter sp.]|nr:hypothetical protein [Candidatus Angelobacter sp.]
MIIDCVISGSVASLLTVFDISRTFYVPTSGSNRRQFFAWAAGFIAANAALAVILYLSIKDVGALKPLNSSLRAVIIGAGYLVLVRSKLATIKVQSEEIPLGLEYVYNAAKEFVYRGMNRTSIAALTTEAASMASQRSLKELAVQAKAYITNNNLLSEDDKNLRKSWLLKVLQDSTSEEEKGLTLATYLLSERM